MRVPASKSPSASDTVSLPNRCTAPPLFSPRNVAPDVLVTIAGVAPFTDQPTRSSRVSKPADAEPYCRSALSERRFLRPASGPTLTTRLSSTESSRRSVSRESGSSERIRLSSSESATICRGPTRVPASAGSKERPGASRSTEPIRLWERSSQRRLTAYSRPSRISMPRLLASNPSRLAMSLARIDRASSGSPSKRVVTGIASARARASRSPLSGIGISRSIRPGFVCPADSVVGGSETNPSSVSAASRSRISTPAMVANGAGIRSETNRSVPMPPEMRSKSGPPMIVSLPSPPSIRSRSKSS